MSLSISGIFTPYTLPYEVITTGSLTELIPISLSISDYIIPDYVFDNDAYNKFISTSIYGNFNVLPDISGSLPANAYFCSNVSISGNLYVNGKLITGSSDF